MKTYEIQKYGGPEGLELVDRSPPRPGDGEVVVRIRAASLNYRDLIVIRGQYERNPQTGRVPLSDGAGEVISVGSGVTRFKIGDRVAGCFCQGWPSGRFRAEMHRTALGGSIDGVLVEEAKFREEGLVHLPVGYSFEEGATLPCAAVTAWQSLITRGQLVPGETVLLLGTGGVSIFALQIAKAAGARVIITSSSDEKLERARKLGADAVINYKTTPDWGKAAASLAGGEGVDHVVEVGGAGTFLQSVRACRFGGKIGLIGILSGREAASEIFPIVTKGAAVFGIYVGSREMFEALNRALEQAKIRPVIDKVFPFEAAREAYEHMASGSHLGKVVIRVGD
ncbi:MAG: NAD(P)-dependent alcohol dehydrogenase [Verrucomicrobia bacterium]|jgi:NADPH:quinone reductase-like Zn-dependent oxidoreductase|nr:NAD(P)-dependent alcohol dehydrogenase [Verrucomicrobiota bacterium]